MNTEENRPFRSRVVYPVCLRIINHPMGYISVISLVILVSVETIFPRSSLPSHSADSSSQMELRWIRHRELLFTFVRVLCDSPKTRRRMHQSGHGQLLFEQTRIHIGNYSKGRRTRYAIVCGGRKWLHMRLLRKSETRRTNERR